MKILEQLGSKKLDHQNIYEDFDGKYLFAEIIHHKKWIFLSSLIFLLCAAIYCSSAEKVWVTQVRIQGPSQIDQKSIFLFNQQILNSKYGFELLSSETILNHFLSYLEKKSESVRIRKDIKKSYLIQFFSLAPVESDENVLSFLKSQNDLYLQDYRDQLLKIIDQRLIDEQLDLFVHDQIQNQRQTSISKLTNEFLFLNQDTYIVNKAAEFKGIFYRDQEVQSMKQALLQIKDQINKPIQGQVFQVIEHIGTSQKPYSPNTPIVLILSVVLGFCVGLFGVLFYISSAPTIVKK